MTLVEKYDRFPPCLCRLIAKTHNGRRWMGLRELAKRSGLSLTQVHRLSKLKSWATVPLEDVDKFAAACGVRWDRLRVARQFLRRRKKVAWQQNKKVVVETMAILKQK